MSPLASEGLVLVIIGAALTFMSLPLLALFLVLAGYGLECWSSIDLGQWWLCSAFVIAAPICARTCLQLHKRNHLYQEREEAAERRLEEDKSRFDEALAEITRLTEHYRRALGWQLRQPVEPPEDLM